VNGKAKLVSEKYCDGLGACLGECPRGAITVEDREAEGFDEEAVARHLSPEEPGDKLPCGCSSATVTPFERQAANTAPPGGVSASRLAHWPVQLALVPPAAPFLQGADLVLAADCVPFAYAGFHQDFLGDNALVVACPKLDDFQSHQGRLNDILRQSGVKSLTVVHMEVPCCSGLVHMARQAIQASGQDIPLREITIGIKGDRKAG
jgi:ferredoxin